MKYILLSLLIIFLILKSISSFINITPSLRTDMSALPSNLIYTMGGDVCRQKGKLYVSVFMFRVLRMDLSLPTSTELESACALSSLITSPWPCPASALTPFIAFRLKPFLISTPRLGQIPYYI